MTLPEAVPPDFVRARFQRFECDRLGVVLESGNARCVAQSLKKFQIRPPGFVLRERHVLTPPMPGIQGVAQTVAEEVEGEHDEGQCDPG